MSVSFSSQLPDTWPVCHGGRDEALNASSNLGLSSPRPFWLMPLRAAEMDMWHYSLGYLSAIWQNLFYWTVSIMKEHKFAFMRINIDMYVCLYHHNHPRLTGYLIRTHATISQCFTLKDTLTAKESNQPELTVKQLPTEVSAEVQQRGLCLQDLARVFNQLPVYGSAFPKPRMRGYRK